MRQQPGNCLLFDRLPASETGLDFTNVLKPHLFLSLSAWRWSIGIVPIVLLYGASANEQLRQFGLDGGACLFKASEPSQHVLETDGGQISDQTVVQVWDEK